MAIPGISGVSLLAAIGKFSEPTAWAELEQLLGLGVDTTEARDGWTENDWVRRDYQVMLMLQAARQRPIEGLMALHRWTQLKTAFRARLRSGELVGTGYVKPVNLADSRMAIPSDKWRFLEPDFRDSTASGDGLEIVNILIDRAEHASEREAEPDGRGKQTPLRVTPKEEPEIGDRNKAVASRKAIPGVPKKSSQKKRRGGPKPGPYYPKLVNIMTLLHEGDPEKFKKRTPVEWRDLVKMRFRNVDVKVYPKSRSGLNKAIANAKREVIDSAGRL